MKSGRVIEVSKSSLISLKAELVRKQEEAVKNKGSESFIRPVPKKKKELKLNPGVEERSLKDEVTQEEVDLHKKSKEVLEVKSKLYDKLQSGESLQENIGDSYLVDFKEKLDKVFSESAKKNAEVEDETYDSNSEDDGWVDYVDYLGRTRRCLKEDLKGMMERDEILGGKPPEEDNSEETVEEPSERQLEMISREMEREKMREKWEQQEQVLINKKNVYYEDIRFDEARTHGVAYYTFSTDESKREEEQAEFKRLREETAVKQKEANEAKERRDSMKQARLMAARQRQRIRLGLPPLSTDVEMESEDTKPEVEVNPVKEESSVQDLEVALTRAAHVRPWDIGKDGVKEPAKVMSQEEWVDKKRDERPEEFAPPVIEEQNLFISKNKGKKRKYLHESHSKKHYEESQDDYLPGPWPEPNWKPLSDYSFPEVSKQTEKFTSKIGVSIPPPATFDYYTPNKRPSYVSKNLPTSSSKEMKESIEAGIEFLKQQSDKREKLLEKKYPNC